MNINAFNNTNPELVLKANEFVNNVFYGTLLREFRNARPQGLMNQGPGAGTFTRQLDQELIKRISSRGDSPIAQALIRQMTGSSEIKKELDKNTLNPMKIRQHNLTDFYNRKINNG